MLECLPPTTLRMLFVGTCMHKIWETIYVYTQACTAFETPFMRTHSVVYEYPATPVQPMQRLQVLGGSEPLTSRRTVSFMQLHADLLAVGDAASASVFPPCAVWQLSCVCGYPQQVSDRTLPPKFVASRSAMQGEAHQPCCPAMCEHLHAAGPTICPRVEPIKLTG